MTEYRVGQLVACVEDNFSFSHGTPMGMTVPKRGTVYTIRTADTFHIRREGRDILFLRFDEIRNPMYPTGFGPAEPVFEASAFLPLDPKRLDIFRGINVPVPA